MAKDLRREDIVAEVREQTYDILAAASEIPLPVAARAAAKLVVDRSVTPVDSGDAREIEAESKKGGLLPLLAAVAGVALLATGG